MQARAKTTPLYRGWLPPLWSPWGTAIAEGATRRFRPVVVCALGLALTRTAAVGAAQVPSAATGAAQVKTLRALRIDAPIVVDGALTEAAWQQAQAISDFVQEEPNVGEPVSERTEVRVLVDDEALYFGVACFDSEPSGIVAKELRRDDTLLNDDRFELILDTFHDHRNAYHFVINPLGTQYDAQITDEGQDINLEWDERWRSEAVIGEQGWTAEIRIPLTALRSQRGADTFGANFARFIRRKNETAEWTAWDRDFTFLQVSQAGHLTGLEGIETGLKLRVKPYALGGFQQSGDSQGSEALRELGLETLRFSLTPGLTTELTLNTDFAQTEVDAAVLNLTRFSTFYPEKREFFLERAGIFGFGLGGRRGGSTELNVQMFFSRRIGLTDDRRAVPLLGGAKVIGRAGGFDLGLLNVQTRPFEDQPAFNYTVLRGKRNVLARSNFGVFVSNRQASGNDYNRVLGVDLNLSLFKNTDIGGFVARSFAPGLEGNSWIGRAKLNWYTDIYELFLEHLYVGPDFRHDVGYVRRRDVRRSEAAFIWEPRPKALEGTVRNFVFRGELRYTTDVQGWLLTREQIFHHTTHFQSGDDFRFFSAETLDRIDEPFEIARDIFVPPGEYRYRQSWVELQGSGKRLLGGRLRFGFGSFYSGRRRSWQLAPSFRPSAHFSLEASYEWNDVSLEEGDFRSHVVNGRANLNLSNRWLTTALLQYDTASERTILYFRLNYIYRPGDDLFVVYSQGDQPGSRPDRKLMVKLTHSFDLR